MPNTAVISNLANDSLTYTTPGTVARLDVGSNATFSGLPSSQLENGQIRVSFLSGATAGDTLSIAYDPSYAVGTANLYNPALGLIYVNTGAGGYPLGNVAGGAGGNDLVFTYVNGNWGPMDPVAATQVILRSLTFSTSAPGSPDRVLSVTVTDSNGDSTAPVVFGVNHSFLVAPTLGVQSVPVVDGGVAVLMAAALLLAAFFTLRQRR